MWHKLIAGLPWASNSNANTSTTNTTNTNTNTNKTRNANAQKNTNVKTTTPPNPKQLKRPSSDDAKIRNVPPNNPNRVSQPAAATMSHVVVVDSRISSSSSINTGTKVNPKVMVSETKQRQQQPAVSSTTASASATTSASATATTTTTSESSQQQEQQQQRKANKLITPEIIEKHNQARRKSSITQPALLLYGKDLSEYDDIPVDDLLEELSPEELEQLSKEVDPDDSSLPPSQRCQTLTTKAATGPLDKKQLIHHLAKCALE